MLDKAEFQDTPSEPSTDGRYTPYAMMALVDHGDADLRVVTLFSSDFGKQGSQLKVCHAGGGLACAVYIVYRAGAQCLLALSQIARHLLKACNTLPSTPPQAGACPANIVRQGSRMTQAELIMHKHPQQAIHLSDH